jgi:hypothetical protein
VPSRIYKALRSPGRASSVRSRPNTSIDIKEQCVRTVHPPLPRIAYALTLFAASTDATAIAEEVAVSGTRPARQNSLSTETLEVLEKRLAQRPERQELQDRNILKGASAQSES